MDLQISDVPGLVGVALILFAYFLLQSERLRFDGYGYLWLNAIGALMIAVSLLFKFNVSAFLIESCWVAISLHGLLRRWRRGRRTA